MTAPIFHVAPPLWVARGDGVTMSDEVQGGDAAPANTGDEEAQEEVKDGGAGEAGPDLVSSEETATKTDETEEKQQEESVTEPPQQLEEGIERQKEDISEIIRTEDASETAAAEDDGMKQEVENTEVQESEKDSTATADDRKENEEIKKEVEATDADIKQEEDAKSEEGDEEDTGSTARIPSIVIMNEQGEEMVRLKIPQ